MKLNLLCVMAFMLLFAAGAQSMPQRETSRLEPLPKPNHESKKENQLGAGLSLLNGTDINKLIASWGTPTTSIALPNEGVMLTYFGSTTANGTPTGCVMNIIAHKNVVVGFKFRGC